MIFGVRDNRPKVFSVCDADGNMDEIQIDALDHDEAASVAMAEWYDGGSFAGDPMPNSINLIVTGDDGVKRVVAVAVDWSPDFFAHDVTDDMGSYCPVRR